MALQDILAAISAQADRRITDARSKHQRSLTQLREESERALSTKKQELALQKTQRKAQMEAKAKTHAAMHERNGELKKKRELLDRTYAAVVEELAKLPDEKIEPLLRTCLKNITTKGTIHPSHKHEKLLTKLADSGRFTVGETIDAKGGFLFVSQTREQDCTLEHLVSEVLRPATELETSHMLFALSA
ncbi:MAG: hypothetical protein WCX61_04755 [Candidatus Peribacteraceae bacterium]|jgi:vacuolar-type H+-ATPase subunit E/Vma4